jgi:hypothetical protein
MEMDFSRIVDRLVRHEHGPRVSVLLQVDPTGLDVARTRIAAKDALDAAAAELGALPGGESVMEPLRALEDRVRNPRFWPDHHLPGMGIFLAPDLEVVVDLPEPPSEAVSVGLVFRVLEVFSAAHSRQCLVLAVSNGAVRLFDVSRDSTVELTVEGMPTSLDDLAKYADIEVSLQFHATARGGVNVFHGHEPGVRIIGHLRDRYLRMIDQAILDTPGLADRPVVLAGVEEIVADYRSISRLPHVVTPFIPGSHDHSSPAEIGRLMHELIGHDDLDPVRARDRATIEAGHRRVLIEPRAVFQAAEEARVESVFLPIDRVGNGLVLDEVAAAVHRNGGRVWIDHGAPLASPVAALLRY